MRIRKSGWAPWAGGAGMVLALAGTCGLWAVNTQLWKVSTVEEFAKGSAEQVVISSLGELTLGPSLASVESGQILVWCAAVDSQGREYFGTGNDARILRRDGKAMVELWSGGKEGGIVSALAVDDRDQLYAATFPGGRVVRIPLVAGPGGAAEASELAKLEETYVWAMAWDAARSALVLGTGPEGKVLQIRAGAGVETLFDSPENHVMSLAVDAAAGAVYAGSSTNGILYRLREGRAETVWDFEENDLRALVSWGGRLYIGANKARKGFDPAKAAKKLRQAAERAKEGESGEAVFQDLLDGAVYRLDPGGAIHRIFEIEKNYVTSLAVTRDGTAFIGTGGEGKLYKVSAQQVRHLYHDFKEVEVLTLIAGENGLRTIGTSNPGVVHFVESPTAPTGTYTSDVLDAQFPSRWGQVSWSATGPVSLRTRSGNTAVPDGTWSAWSEPLRTSPAATASPAGRYLQFRLTWDQDPAAAVRWVITSYVPANQMPQFKEATVEAYDPAESFKGKAKESTELKLKWKAQDPDGDELLYRVYYRRADETDWVPVNAATPATKPEFKWDTSSMADGWVEVKVEASDEAMNDRESALTAFRTVPPVLIDNRKPQLSRLEVAHGEVVGAAEDSYSAIARVEYRLNEDRWQFVAPEDGVYDQRQESFRIRLRDLPPGRSVMYVRVFDAGGNVCGGQVAVGGP